MKTAIEFLFEEMNRIRLEDESGNIGVIEFFQLQQNAYEKAKEIEKKEIIDAYWGGLNYSINNDCSVTKIISDELKGIKIEDVAELYYNKTYKDGI